MGKDKLALLDTHPIAHYWMTAAESGYAGAETEWRILQST